MKKTNKLILAAVLAVALPTGAFAADADLQAKIDKLSQQMDDLKGQVERIEDKSLGKWLTISGDYRFRVDSLTAHVKDHVYFGTTGMSNVTSHNVKNSTYYTNRFGLDLKAKATKDVTFNARLLMYKGFGVDQGVATPGLTADRSSIFDGVLGHVPSSDFLNVDRAYATWSNIGDQPVWFSVGRRPSSNGAPTNLKSNTERPGNGGTPALLVDYAFDGMTLGYAPDIDFLPGFYTKVCYGRGFDSGINQTATGATNKVKDTDMLGVAIIPVDTDPLRVWLQWNRGFGIFDNPAGPTTNLGNIDWFGAGAMTTLKKVGPGDLNFFADFGMSKTDPNYNRYSTSPFGLMTGTLSGATGPVDEGQASKTGYAVYTGLRYDFPTRTKLGFEYNYGSKNWITFAPAADDMFSAKVGTRGHVFEPYVIQELNLKPVSSAFAKAFFKLGYQYYAFEYTGSNNWVGSPIAMKDVTSATILPGIAAVDKAQTIYGTFEVHF
jgi:opacity protein-like surface antigen